MVVTFGWGVPMRAAEEYRDDFKLCSDSLIGSWVQRYLF